jgi:hypothetical protein
VPARIRPFGGNVERRKAVRFPLQAPVILQWREPSGTTREDLGQTHNVSILGAFVVCSLSLPTGTIVSLEVRVPPLERNTFQSLRLRGHGTVTRSAAGEEGGFATNSPFILEESKPDSTSR